MKKLIMMFILLISGISFSGADTCKWIKNPDIYVTKEIELINHSQLKETFIVM